MERDWRRQRRQRRIGWLAALLLLAALGVLAAIRARRPRMVARPVSSTLATPDAPEAARIGDVTVLSLTGSPRDLGARYGRLLREPIRRVIDGYLSPALRAQGLERAKLPGLLAPMGQYLPQTLVDTLEGMAEGSGLPYADLLALQSAPELGVPLPGCAYAALTPATLSRELLLGYDLGLDHPALRGDDLVVLAVAEEGAQPYCGVTLAGQVAPLIGTNRDGFGAALLPARGARGRFDGLPLLGLMRRLLQSGNSLDDTRQLLEATPLGAAGTVLAGDTQPELRASALEFTRRGCVARDPDQGRLVATELPRVTHQPPLADTDAGADPRFDRLRAWLSDHAGQLGRLSRPFAAAGLDGGLVEVVLDPRTNTLGVSLGPKATQQAPTWLRWDPASGRITAADAAAGSR